MTTTFEVDVEGVTYEVDAPDEATAWRWANMEHAKTKPPTMHVMSGDKPVPSLLDPDMIAGSPLARVAKGAASPFVGGIQLSSKINDVLYKALGIPFRPGETTDDYIARLEKLTQEGRAKYGSEGFDWFEALGNVFSPAFLAALKLPVAATKTGKVGQGTALGTVAGASAPVTEKTTPEEFAKKKAVQTASGAAIGGAIPAVAIPAKKVGQMVYHGLIEPAVAPAAIKGRAFLEAAGDKADEIINLLRSPNEIVPGSAPTAGQAATPAGRAEFAALQRSAENAKPSDYIARNDAQNAARLDAVRTVGKDKAALEAAEQTRSLTTGEMYSEAYEVMVKRDPELRAMWKNPFFREAVGDAWKLAKAEGISPRKNLTEFLHLVKISLDDQLAKGPATGGTALTSNSRRAVQNIKKQLVDWMGAKNPQYEAARAEFAAQSAPINQMKVGQYLEDKLVPAVSDEAKQSATSFSNALRAAPLTIKKATGGPRFQELSKVLTPEQLTAVQSVQDDLARGARFEELARKGAKAGPNALDLATANLEREMGGRIPNILHRGAMLANAVIMRVEGKINKKLAAEMAIEMLNPQQVGESLAKAKARAAYNGEMTKKLYKALRLSAGPLHADAKRAVEDEEE